MYVLYLSIILPHLSTHPFASFFFLYCIEVYIIIIQISYDHRCFFVKISFFISIKYRLIDVFVCVYVFVYE